MPYCFARGFTNGRRDNHILILQQKTKHLTILCIFIFTLIWVPILWGTEERPKTEIFVTIPPQAYLVKKLCPDRCAVYVLIQPGASPHAYEPTPRQITLLSKARAYFTIGLPVEEALLPRIKKINKSLIVVPTQEGVIMRPMEHQGPHSGTDPHIWLDPGRAKIMAHNIHWALTRLIPEETGNLDKNLRTLTGELNMLHEEIRQILAPVRGKKLYVFHPAFGYLAEAYGLKQVPIEMEGKEPSPKYLARLISEAQKDRVKAIFVQPQFSPKGAKALAQAIGAKVIPLDPLAYDYAQNMIKMAKQIRENVP